MSLDLPKLQSIHLGRSTFWCSLYAFTQKQGLSSTNGYTVYSQSTKLTIPADSCNEQGIEELRFDGYSHVNELIIEENTFQNTNNVYIEEMKELKSLHVGSGSFVNQTPQLVRRLPSVNGLYISDCTQLNTITVGPQSFMYYNELSLQSRRVCNLLSRSS